MAVTTPQIEVGSALTEQQAREIFSRGEEAVVFALLQLAQRLAMASGLAAGKSFDAPATPSGIKPPYAQPTSSRRRKRPEQKPGHPGVRREPPARIDVRETHRADVCPECGGPLCRCTETRTRYTEDIPEVQPVVTEHTIHRDWCPQCRRKVEPTVTTALPGATLGNRLLVLTAWLHYALGNTLGQIGEVLNFHLQMPVSSGGLLDMWRRLAAILYDWYEQIHREALDSAVLHADESGWRVDGKTHWLWCFANDDLSYFLIDRSRGHPALLKFFTQEFGGILVSDFWGAYNAVVCALRQTCLAHLLRDLEHVEKYQSPGEHWPAFAKKLRRLLADAIRLWRRRDELPPETYTSRRQCLTARLDELIATTWEDSQARRLIKRLRRHRFDLFTFLDHAGVPFENNLAAPRGYPAIRPGVILRKNCYGNRSPQGADIQAILMSVLFTLKKRGHNPLHTLYAALATYLRTNQLPPLPAQATPGG